MKLTIRWLALALVLMTLTACPNNTPSNTPQQNDNVEQGSGMAQPEPEVNQDQNPD